MRASRGGTVARWLRRIVDESPVQFLCEDGFRVSAGAGFELRLQAEFVTSFALLVHLAVLAVMMRITERSPL